MTLLFGPRLRRLPRASGRRRHKNFISGAWIQSTVSGPPNACWRGRTPRNTTPTRLAAGKAIGGMIVIPSGRGN